MQASPQAAVSAAGAGVVADTGAEAGVGAEAGGASGAEAGGVAVAVAGATGADGDGDADASVSDGFERGKGPAVCAAVNCNVGFRRGNGFDFGEAAGAAAAITGVDAAGAEADTFVPGGM